MTTLKTVKLSALAVLAAAGTAQAHATFTSATVTAEGYALMQLQVPHGCDGMATNEVRIELPEGFVFAKPQPKPGWELEIIRDEYQKTYDNHGKKVSAGPAEIRWKGGELLDEHYDTFVIQGKISGVAPGEELAFPTVQLCGSNGRVEWTEVAAPGQDPHGLKNPAPVVRVVENKEHANAGGPSPAKVGDIVLEGAFTRAMLPNQPVGGGFVTIRNEGGADRLVSAASPAAGTVEIHEMAMEGEVMRMRKLENGIDLPAGETVELKPGGLHLMFMQVKTPFKEGDSIPVTLTFEKAGSVDVIFPVGGAAPTAHKHH